MFGEYFIRCYTGEKEGNIQKINILIPLPWNKIWSDSLLHTGREHVGDIPIYFVWELTIYNGGCGCEIISLNLKYQALKI